LGEPQNDPAKKKISSKAIAGTVETYEETSEGGFLQKKNASNRGHDGSKPSQKLVLERRGQVRS